MDSQAALKFGQQMAASRRALKMTQSELAAILTSKLGVNFDAKKVSRLENGMTQPTTFEMKIIAETLRFSIDEALDLHFSIKKIERQIMIRKINLILDCESIDLNSLLAFLKSFNASSRF